MAWKNYHVYYIWYNKYHIWCNTSLQKAKRLCCLLNTSVSRTYYLLILKFHGFLKYTFQKKNLSHWFEKLLQQRIFLRKVLFLQTADWWGLWQVWIWYPAELALQLYETKRHKGRKEKQWDVKVKEIRRILCTDKKLLAVCLLVSLKPWAHFVTPESESCSEVAAVPLQSTQTD